ASSASATRPPALLSSPIFTRRCARNLTLRISTRCGASSEYRCKRGRWCSTTVRLSPRSGAPSPPRLRRPRWRTDMFMRRLCVTAFSLVASLACAHAQSPNGVKTLNPPGAIKAEGTWSLGARAGDFVFIAGMQGIDPATNALVKDPQARILQAFRNIKTIADSEGASLRACVRLTFDLSDLPRYAPMVEKAQKELWGGPPYPPRTMIEVKRLFDDDIAEIYSVVYAPVRK